jgi:hypothetical protein
LDFSPPSMISIIMLYLPVGTREEEEEEEYLKTSGG